MRDSDMPSTEDGIKPSIIINPHSIPSRMTIGQLLESFAGTLCAAKAAQIDATIFKKVDIESIATELENLGLDRYGYRRLYNGITGEYIDAEIFIGPTYYQRLQKFTIDTMYSISAGPSDAITYQPLDGKSSGGGLRIGEIRSSSVSVMFKSIASMFVTCNTFFIREHLVSILINWCIFSTKLSWKHIVATGKTCGLSHNLNTETILSEAPKYSRKRVYGERAETIWKWVFSQMTEGLR